MGKERRDKSNRFEAEADKNYRRIARLARRAASRGAGVSGAPIIESINQQRETIDVTFDERGQPVVTVTSSVERRKL